MAATSGYRRFRPLVLPSLLLLSCGPAQDSALEGYRASVREPVMGADDQGDSAVVGVLSDRGSTVGFCTGALIAPNLVLTARHCIAPNEGAIECGVSKFGTPDPVGALWVTPDWNGPELQMPYYKFDQGNWFRVAETIVSDGDEMCGHDVALLRLTNPGMPASLAQPLAPRIDSAPVAGEEYRVVGFGSSGPGLSDFGRRRQLAGLHVMCSGNCTSQQLDPAAEWQGLSGECIGDSGGPALDSNDQVIGVLSRSYSDCTMPVYESVVLWAAWLQNHAVAAALAGGYDPPVWAGATDAGSGGADADGPTGGASGSAATDASIGAAGQAGENSGGSPAAGGQAGHAQGGSTASAGTASPGGAAGAGRSGAAGAAATAQSNAQDSASQSSCSVTIAPTETESSPSRFLMVLAAATFTAHRRRRAR